MKSLKNYNSGDAWDILQPHVGFLTASMQKEGTCPRPYNIFMRPKSVALRYEEGSNIEFKGAHLI